MTWWQRLRERDQLDAELRDHVEQQVSDDVRRGLSHTEARRRARLELGGVEQTKEACRDVRGTRWVDDMGQDIHFAMRLLGRHGWFSLVSVVALALGISATTAAFSTFDALLLRTLPVPNAERLVVLAPPVDESVFRGRLPFSFYETLRETDAGFSGVLATTRNPAVLVSADVTASVGAEFVTPGYFDVLGVNPSLGRWSDDDAGAVVSHRLWTTAFDGRPDLLDTAVRINGRLFVITGVAPPEFTGTLVGDSVGGAPDLWLPISMFGRVTGVGTTAPRVDIMARLTPSETLDQAAARLPSVTQRWIEQTGAQATGPEATAVRLIPGSQGIPSSLRDAFRGSVWLLLGLCGCLWLIATTNAAGLGLARLRARHREIGVRLALGASWTRLARQLLTESALLAGLGGVLGVLVAHQLTRAVAVFAPA